MNLPSQPVYHFHRHVKRTHQRTVGRTIRSQPSASGEPALPHTWYSDDSCFARILSDRLSRHKLWWIALALFVSGWILQFIGHAFEGKPPEFFSDWRFLFVGVRWWWAKMNRRA